MSAYFVLTWQDTIPAMGMTRPAQFVLITAFVVLLFNSGARFFMGLILHPMSTDLGWERTTLSSTVTLFLVVSAATLFVMSVLALALIWTLRARTCPEPDYNTDKE